MVEKDEPKKPPKEYIKLLEERLYVKPVGIVNRLKEVEAEIVNNIEPGKVRFKKLLQELDKTFPPNTALRGAADGITYFLFDSAFELYFIGNNSALFIELQGLLERFCVNKACEYIAVNSEAKEILMDSFSKKTLNDIADYFETISYWNQDEVKFAKKLSQIRNGIAHKNVELVSKHLSDGKQVLLTSINDITKKADIVPFIIKTIELLVKISDAHRPAFLSNPRFQARFEAYSSIIGYIFNLFCDSEFIALPNEIKFTMLNRMFGRAILLCSDELREHLNKYKSIVIEFHDKLGVEEEKSKQLHTTLVELGEEIFKLMRTDLKIDGDPTMFKEPSKISVDFARVRKLQSQHKDEK